jgi:transposase-like protein
LLRREGIYHSQLQTWRAQLAASGSNGLRPQRPGPVPKHDAKDREIQALTKKLMKLERELVIVNGLVELQKKVQAIVSAMQQDEPPCTP